MGQFDTLNLLPPDPIFGLIPLFQKDPNPNKINLGVGSFKDDEGKSTVLNVVRKAETLIEQKRYPKDYQSIQGNPCYCQETSKLILGENHPILSENRITTTQTVGASGALRIGAELLVKLGIEEIALSNPTWANHKALMSAGGLKINSYAYYNKETNDLDFSAMKQSIENLPNKSAILLHACCHNPTGMDPTYDQWKEISQLIKEKEILPFFDSAYQGFKEDIEKDASAMRLFAEEGHEFLVAYSYSKNMGLYGERAGALACITTESGNAPVVQSHINKIIRSSYSSPSLHPAQIVSAVLSDENLKNEWIEEVASMRNRIINMRVHLIQALDQLSLGEYYQFLHKQQGMFSFLGLQKEEVIKLRDEYAIYMPDSGRINIAGLNQKNLDYFIQALTTVRKSHVKS